MTVYVDEPLMPYRGYLVCHCFTDQWKQDELHELMRRIGVKRSWYENKHPHDHPHYDLLPWARAKALENGAQFMSGKDWVRLIVWPRRARLGIKAVQP